MSRCDSPARDGRMTQADTGDLEGPLRQTVETVCARFPDRHVWQPGQLLGCARWIEDEARAAGFEVRRQSFEATFWTDDAGTPARLEVCNLCIDIPGREDVLAPLVLGAHYDVRHGMAGARSRRPRFEWDDLPPGDPRTGYSSTPGANDNASGVAALLALLRGFREMPPVRPIEAAFWVNEEYPFFRNYWRNGRLVRDRTLRAEGMGSYRHASAMAEAGARRPCGAVSLDTLGCYGGSRQEAGLPRWSLRSGLCRMAVPADRGTAVVLSDIGSRSFARQIASTLAKHAAIPVRSCSLPGVRTVDAGWSDDWAYWQFGMPACCITDTAYLRSGHYHRTTDRPDTLNYPAFAALVAGLQTALATHQFLLT